MAFSITSPAFAANGDIPPTFTADGEDVSPPLTWRDAPPGVKSFALVVDDPDAPDPRAPKRRWVHWVVYDVPADVSALHQGELPRAAREGKNDWGEPGWRGPAPPIGRHRYVHRLYALDVVLPDLGTPTKAELEKALTGHVLATAELVGTYERRH